MTMPDYVCSGETRRYFVNPGQDSGSTYTWRIDGRVIPDFDDSELIYTWTRSKTYLLEVQERSANGCLGPKISGKVLVNQLPEIQVNVSDSMICSGESVTFSVRNPSVLIWGMWVYDLIIEPESGIIGNTISNSFTSPADLRETLFNHDRQIRKVIYWFIPYVVSDEGVRSCEGEKVNITVWIHPGFRCKEVFLQIPDAFSPNGDGVNDVWNIIGKDAYPFLEVTIYDRWGKLVWKSGKEYPLPWDGKSGGDDLPVDSYHYYLELHNGTKPIIGTVTIVR
jgi:gliding motility-associated-like protein